MIICRSHNAALSLWLLSALMTTGEAWQNWDTTQLLACCHVYLQRTRKTVALGDNPNERRVKNASRMRILCCWVARLCGCAGGGFFATSLIPELHHRPTTHFFLLQDSFSSQWLVVRKRNRQGQQHAFHQRYRHCLTLSFRQRAQKEAAKRKEPKSQLAARAAGLTVRLPSTRLCQNCSLTLSLIYHSRLSALNALLVCRLTPSSCSIWR